MDLVTWDSKYNVDIEVIDNQHKELVRQINVLHSAMKNGKSKEYLGGILDALFDYAGTHFKCEEEILSKNGYEDSEEHIAEHLKFVAEISDFKEEFDQGKIMISIKLVSFLKNWLLNHILETDMRYKPFLKSKGVI